MALPTNVIRGKYTQIGVPGTFDAYLYATQQTGTFTQNMDTQKVQDSNGADVSWLFQNENLEADYALKLIGDTSSHTLAPAQAVSASPTGYTSPGTGAYAGSAVSSLGQPFLSPGSCIVFTASSPTLAAADGIFQVQPGSSMDLSNQSPGDLKIKLKRYANADQNNLMATTPS